MVISIRGLKALAMVAVLLLQCTALGVAAAGPGSDRTGGDRLPSDYLTVFMDDFEAGVIDPSNWLYWDGPWSTDNVAVNPSGGFYTGDETYLTESPYMNQFGSPLDDNGNEGIYFEDEKAMIETNWIDLHNLSTPKLEFDHMYDIPSKGDGAMVFVLTDQDQTWNLLEPETHYPEPTGWSGFMQTWVTVTFRLDDYEGQRIRLGFSFRSSPDGVEGDGWKIDDIAVGGKYDQQVADLKLGNVRVLLNGESVSAALSGDVLELNMSVINEGRANVDAFIVSAYTDHPLRGGALIGRKLIMGGLGVGMSTSVSMLWVASPGTYALHIYVDESNYVPEKNEVNNQRIYDLIVDVSTVGDIALKDLHFEANGDSIQGAGVGDLIEIVATLENAGTQTVITPMVVRAYDGPVVPGAVPIGDLQPRLNGMEEGGMRVIRIPWRPLEGVHNVHLLVTSQDPAVPLDYNSRNNLTWADLVVTDHPSVDLYVEDLVFIVDGRVTTQASEGNNVHTVATIGNRGSSPFYGLVEVGIYRGDPDAGGQIVGDRLLIANLEVGATLDVEFDWRAELGTHAVTIFIDAGNLIYESDEDNNQMGKGLTVSRQPLPDLTVGAMRLLLNGEEIDLTVGTHAGANVEVNITVLNTGTAMTKNPITVELYYGNPLLGAKTLGTFTVPEGLNPDEVFISSLYWKAEKPKLKDELPLLFVRVDSTGVEPEVDEFNNDDLRPLKVGASLPDLTVISLAVTDEAGAPVASITYGTTVKLEVAVTNVGTDVSFQVAQVNVYMDKTEEGSPIATMTTSTLGIGETVKRSETWTPLPGKVAGGTHTLIALVDPSDEIEESSDANNHLSTELYVDGDARPNLLLQDIWVTKDGKIVDHLDHGTTATIHLRVVNLGRAPLFTAASVELFHGDPTQGGLPISNWQVMDLAIRENITFDVEWKFEEDLPLVVYIDRNHAVEETNENDNVASYYLEVSPPPEGANLLVIGLVMGLALLVLVILAFVLTRRPTARAKEPEEEPSPEAPSEEVATDASAEPPAGSTGEVAPATVPAPSPEAPAEVAPSPEGEEGDHAEAQEAPAEAPAPVAACPHCGEEVDPEWILCPFCDKALK